MSQQVQELIDKIKSEGLEAAQEKAKEIEAEAQKNAQKMIVEAQRQAEIFLREAKAEIKTTQESSRIALKQASRDTLLCVRKEIESIFKKIITTHVSDALTSEKLGHILEEVMKHSLDGKTNHANIQIILNHQDLEQLKKSFIAKLQEGIKHPIQFQSSDEIGSGFMMSYDGGKSSFDFTDRSLAQYLSSYLNNELAELIHASL